MKGRGKMFSFPKASKVISVILVLCLAAGMMYAFTLTATADNLYSVTDICDYTITIQNVGLSHYRDGEGEEKLFDGIIPTTEDLDDAVEQAIAEEADESLRGWFQWKGWIGIHSTGTDAYKVNSAVDVNFAFTEEVNLKKLVVHCAAMVKGNVWIPSNYQIFLSNDGVVWEPTPIIEQPTEYNNGTAINNINAFDDTIIELEEAVTTQYFKLVANGVGCWWFCSEVEIFAEDDSLIIIEDSSDETTAESTAETTSEAATSSEETKPVAGEKINVAKDKTYTVTETTPRNDTRDDTELKKLTDGIKVRDTSGGADIAGYLTKHLEVVIDLEETTAISGFFADALGYTPWGISSPTTYTVEFLYSDDGADFTSAGTVKGEDLEPAYGDETTWVAYEFIKDFECEARYVKVIYDIPEDQNGHLWITELEVYSTVIEDEEPETSETSGTTPTGDKGFVALSIIALISLAGVAVIKRK